MYSETILLFLILLGQCAGKLFTCAAGNFLDEKCWEDNIVPDYPETIECDGCNITIDSPDIDLYFTTKGKGKLIISEQSTITCSCDNIIETLQNSGNAFGCHANILVNRGTCSECTANEFTNYGKATKGTAKKSVDNTGTAEISSTPTISITNTGSLTVITDCTEGNEKNFALINNKGTITFSCTDTKHIPVISAIQLILADTSVFKGTLKISNGLKTTVRGTVDKLLAFNGTITNSEFTVSEIEVNVAIDMSNITVTKTASVSGTLTDVSFYGEGATVHIAKTATANERVSVSGTKLSTIVFESQTPPPLISLDDSTGVISLPETASTIIIDSASMVNSLLTIDTKSLVLRNINGSESQIDVQYISGGTIVLEGASLSGCTITGNSESAVVIPSGKVLQLENTSIETLTKLDGGITGQGTLTLLEINQCGSFTNAVISVKHVVIGEESSQESFDIVVRIKASTLHVVGTGNIGNFGEKVTFEGTNGNVVFQESAATTFKGQITFNGLLHITNKGIMSANGATTVEFQPLSRFVGESGRFLLDSVLSVLILKAPGSEINPSFSLEGAGTFSLYTDLKYQADTETEFCSVGVSISLEDSAELELTNCQTILFNKKVSWNSGVISSTRTPHTIVTVEKSFVIDTSAQHTLTGIQAILKGATLLSSATLNVEDTELLQHGTLTARGTSEIVGAGQSSFENAADFIISGSCTVSEVSQAMTNTGNISVSGKASLLNSGKNKGTISVSSDGKIILQDWTFSDASLLKSTKITGFSQVYTEESNGIIITKGTTVLNGAAQNAIIVFPKGSIVTIDENFRMDSSAVSMSGGTMTGALIAESNSCLSLGCGTLKTTKIAIAPTGKLYAGACEESANNKLQIQSSTITSSGVAELNNVQISSQETQFINTETGTLTINTKQSEPEQLPFPVDNKGLIQIGSGAIIKLSGNSDGTITLSGNTSAVYFCKNFIFGVHSAVQGGPAYCDETLTLDGTFHELNALSGCELTISSTDTKPNALITTFNVKSTQIVSIKQPLSMNTLFAEVDSKIILSDKIAINKNMNIEKGCSLSGGTITVGTHGNYAIQAETVSSTTLVLSGDGTIDEGAKSISTAYISGTLSVVPNTSAPTKVAIAYTLLCSTGALLSKTDYLSITLLDTEHGSTIQAPGIISTNLNMLDKSTLCPQHNSSERKTVIDVGMLISKTTVGFPEQSGLPLHTNGIMFLEKLSREINCNDLCVVTTTPSYQGPTYLHNNGVSLVDNYNNNALTIYNEGTSTNAHHWLTISDTIIYNTYAQYFKDSKDKIVQLKEQEQNVLNANQLTIIVDVDQNLPPSDHFNKKFPFLHIEDSTIGILSIQEGTCWISSSIAQKVIIQNEVKLTRLTRNYQELQGYFEDDSSLIIVQKDFTSDEYQQKSGVTLLDGGKLISSAVTISGGSLQGSGTIDGSLFVEAEGIIAPRFGVRTLHVSDNLLFSGQGKFVSNVLSRTTYDTITSKTLSVKGGMIIVLFPNSTRSIEKEPFPTVGDEFKLLSFTQKELDSKFTSHKLIDVPQGLIEQWDYTANAIILRFIGCAAGMVPDDKASCIFCPLNTWSTTGDKECTKCQAGYERKAGQNGCQLIPEFIPDGTSSSDESEKESKTQTFIAFLLLGFGLFMLIHSSFKQRKYYNVYLERHITKKRSRSYSVESSRIALQTKPKERRKSIHFEKVPALISLLGDLREDPLKYCPVKAKMKLPTVSTDSPKERKEKCSIEEHTPQISQLLGAKQEETEKSDDTEKISRVDTNSISDVDIERQKTLESFVESSTSLGMYTFDEQSSSELKSLEEILSTPKEEYANTSKDESKGKEGEKYLLPTTPLDALSTIDFEVQKTTAFSPVNNGFNVSLSIDVSPIETKQSRQKEQEENKEQNSSSSSSSSSEEEEEEEEEKEKEEKEKEEKEEELLTINNSYTNVTDATEIQLATQELRKTLSEAKGGELPLGTFADIAQKIQETVTLSTPLTKQQSCAMTEFMKTIEESAQYVKEQRDVIEQLRHQQAKRVEELNYRAALARKAGNQSPGWAVARIDKIELRNAQPRFIDINLGASPNLYFKNNQRVNRKLDFSEESG